MSLVKPVQGKGLTVDMGYASPKFVFTGDWTGSDIKVVQALIRREYFRYQRSIRRAPEPVSAN